MSSRSHPVIAAPPATVRVTLPLHTVSEANARGHWSGKAKRARIARSLVALVLPLHRRIILPPPWLVTLIRISPSSGLDDDNLRSALKAVRDQVADELGLPNDSDPRMWAYDQRRGSRKDLTLVRGYGVEIRIGARP